MESNIQVTTTAKFAGHDVYDMNFFFYLPPGSKFGTWLSVKHDWYGLLRSLSSQTISHPPEK